MGFWFLLFQFASRQSKRAIWASATFCVLSIIALLRLPRGWLVCYRENLHYFSALAGVNDFTTANPIRFDLVNLQVMFYATVHKYELANLLSWCVTAILLLVWWKRRRGAAELILIGLLPVYQRIYNASVILLAIAWGVSNFRHWRGKAVVLISSVFLVPGAAFLQSLHARGAVSDAAWNYSLPLNVFVGPLATWAIVAVVVILLSVPTAALNGEPRTFAKEGTFWTPRL